MEQRYFIDSWLSPCSLRSHRTANSSPKNELRHFSALPTHHPNIGARNIENEFINNYSKKIPNFTVGFFGMTTL